MLSTIGEYIKSVFICDDLQKNEDGEYPVNIQTVMGPQIAKRILDFEIKKVKDFQEHQSVVRKTIDLQKYNKSVYYI